MIIRATTQTKLACGALILIIINVIFLIVIIAIISKEIMCQINGSQDRSLKPNRLLKSPQHRNMVNRNFNHIHKTPWLLSFITIPENSLIGGATIISQKWALTTAYCIEKVAHFPLSNKGFRGGSLYWNKEGHIHFAVKIIPHYNFNPLTLDFNLAIVEVTPLFMKKQEIPIAIAGNHLINFNQKSSARIIGWATINKNTEINEYVVAGTVDIMTTKKCKEKFKKVDHNMKLNLSRLICGNTVRSQGINNCSFIHGTPLIKNNTLIGLASWGAICNENRWPGIYVSITTMVDWINKIQLEEEILPQKFVI